MNKSYDIKQFDENGNGSMNDNDRDKTIIGAEYFINNFIENVTEDEESELHSIIPVVENGEVVKVYTVIQDTPTTNVIFKDVNIIEVRKMNKKQVDMINTIQNIILNDKEYSIQSRIYDVDNDEIIVKVK